MWRLFTCGRRWNYRVNAPWLKRKAKDDEKCRHKEYSAINAAMLHLPIRNFFCVFDHKSVSAHLCAIDTFVRYHEEAIYKLTIAHAHRRIAFRLRSVRNAFRAALLFARAHTDEHISACKQCVTHMTLQHASTQEETCEQAIFCTLSIRRLDLCKDATWWDAKEGTLADGAFLVLGTGYDSRVQKHWNV